MCRRAASGSAPRGGHATHAPSASVAPLRARPSQPFEVRKELSPILRGRREKYRAGRAREVSARSAPEDLPLLARHARQCARHTRSHRQRGLSHDRQQKRTVPTQEDPMNADVLTTRVADGIAVITLGSPRRIYFDQEMGDALTEALDGFAGDAKVRVVVITGGAPGYFNRHFDVGVLIDLAESLRASGREWPENATYNGGFFDKAMALCESMPKPVIAAISGTALAGAFEFALSCDL